MKNTIAPITRRNIAPTIKPIIQFLDAFDDGGGVVVNMPAVTLGDGVVEGVGPGVAGVGAGKGVGGGVTTTEFAHAIVMGATAVSTLFSKEATHSAAVARVPTMGFM